MLLCPANTLSNPAPDKTLDPSVLPIEEIKMPEENVSDLKEVFDAINKLCDTMKTTSSYDERDEEELNANIVGSEADPNIVAEIHPSVIASQYDLGSEMVISEYENVISECDSSTLVASENDSTMIASTIDTSMLASEIFSSMLASQNDNIAAELPEIDTDVTLLQYRDFHKEKVDAKGDLHKESTKNPPVDRNEQVIAQSIQVVTQSVQEVTQSVQEVTQSIQEVTQSFEYPDLHKEKASDVENEDLIAQRIPENTERWSDAMSHISNATVTSDTTTAQCEEVYYTASSEVSLLSDTELPDKPQEDKDGNYVIAGHVAAMRERFESMTRTNTPCPDLVRSLSPSLEVFRTTSPSPDRMT